MLPLDAVRQIYEAERTRLLNDRAAILAAEKRVTDTLADIFDRAISEIASVVDEASEMKPFWGHYPPRQRGRAPTGKNMPWNELVEKSTLSVIDRMVSKRPEYGGLFGLPYGGDARFILCGAVVHLDVKASGRIEGMTNEVVAEPNQLSGDGLVFDATGVSNSLVQVPITTPRGLQPKLPPLYVNPRTGEPRLTATLFMRVIYDEMEDGRQPVTRGVLVSVPNGLRLWSGCYSNSLFREGKDVRTNNPEQGADRRVRIMYLNLPQSECSWRVRTVRPKRLPAIPLGLGRDGARPC